MSLVVCGPVPRSGGAGETLAGSVETLSEDDVSLVDGVSLVGSLVKSAGVGADGAALTKRVRRSRFGMLFGFLPVARRSVSRRPMSKRRTPYSSKVKVFSATQCR